MFANETQLLRMACRNRLLAELDIETAELFQHVHRLFGGPALVRVQPNGAAVHGTNRLERFHLTSPAKFDLENRELPGLACLLHGLLERRDADGERRLLRIQRVESQQLIDRDAEALAG